MNETCDRCGPAVGAGYRVDRVSELYLSGQCASPALAGAICSGLDLLAAGRACLAPQASAASRDDPVQDAA
jgi:hypothetical protein